MPRAPVTGTELLERAVRSAGKRADKHHPRWVHVMHVFALGSTSASRLCERFGIDPHEQVGGCERCAGRESDSYYGWDPHEH